MAKSTSFADSFPQLLQAIPANLTLAQWQYLYRQVIVSMGLKILDLFEQDALGANPFDPTARGGSTGGPQPGAHPAPPPINAHADTARGGSTGGPQPAISIAQAALGLLPVVGTRT
jgi:hypothetical protein